MSKIKLLIADDHAVLREGLALLIDAQPDMAVVAQAGSGPEAVSEAKKHNPEVVVMDLSMPGGGGLDAVTELRRIMPEIRVVVLSMHDDTSHLRAVLASGASGFIAKHAAGDRLLAAIREVHQGRSSITVKLTDTSLAELFDRPISRSSTLSDLTKREREVLQLVAEGFSNSQIGLQLGVSKKSVDTYRSRVCQKLGLKNRAELVRYALEVGVLRAREREPESR
jgi:two-component system, NarL family, response regulator NreC